MKMIVLKNNIKHKVIIGKEQINFKIRWLNHNDVDLQDWNENLYM
jgi:hypothetical protein